MVDTPRAGLGLVLGLGPLVRARVRLGFGSARVP